MARYRITELSHINLALVQAGEEIEVSDSIKPGPHWEPLDAAAKKAFAAAGFKEVGYLADPVNDKNFGKTAAEVAAEAALAG